MTKEQEHGGDNVALRMWCMERATAICFTPESVGACAQQIYDWVKQQDSAASRG